MPHQDKSQKYYLDLGINLEWLNSVITRTCVYSDRLAGALYIDDYDGEQCQCSDSYTK